MYDYVREPDRDSVINYAGKYPAKFVTFLKKAASEFLAVPERDIHEMAYNWEKKGSLDKFKVEWRCIKEFDEFTHLQFDIKLNGEETDGEGKCMIILKPRMVTEYPQDTILQQNIFYEMARTFWHTTYYSKKRWQYMRQSRDLWNIFEKNVKDFCEKCRNS